MNALRQALLQGRRRPRHAGAGSPTLYRGDGFEFVELRQYVPGDDIRRIDWAASARSGTLQTRVVLEDVALTIAAIIDTSPSMRVGRRRELAQSAREIAEQWFDAATGGDRCYRVLEDDVCAPWAARERAAFSLTAACELAAAALPRGTALLVVSDFLDLPSQDELLVRLARRFDCTALIARDPWYDGLPISGFTRFRDIESGKTALLYLGKRERMRYVAAMRDRERALAARFRHAAWRSGVFDETEGGTALLRAFGLR